MSVRLLLFDIDGTLVDTLGAGRAALAVAMESVYGETGPIDTFDFHGRTDPAIVRGLLRAAGWSDARIDERLDETWEAYLAALDAELGRRDGSVRPCPGVERLLTALEGDERFAVGLVTGNVAGGARRKLAAAALADHFRFGAYGSDSERREDLPPIAAARAERVFGRPFDLPSAVVIGDTPEDIRCARANGARALAVSTGRHTLGELERHGPEAMLETLSDTERVIRVLADE